MLIYTKMDTNGNKWVKVESAHKLSEEHASVMYINKSCVYLNKNISKI